MDHFLLLSILFDYYGGLLTPTQQKVCQLYYNQDFSLAEISEHLQITRQGVHDSLKKAEQVLLRFEDILKIHDKNIKLGNLVSGISGLVQASSMEPGDKERVYALADQINQLL